MKTILVPTDFSDAAFFALKVAAKIARKIKARIKLVHVYNLPSAGISHFAYYENFFDQLKSNAEMELEKLLRSSSFKGLEVEPHLLSDMLMWEMIISNKFRNADLIVMGSHGKSGFSRFFIGSNTEKVVRFSEAPVLTIKSDMKNFTVRKLVFASDYEKESYNAFKKIRFLIDAYEPELYLLKVISPSDFESTPDSLRLINGFRRRFSLNDAQINVYNSKSIESGILQFSHSINADLVAIPTHGRTGIAHLINGSLAESLVKHDPKPVLSIRIPEIHRPRVTKMAPKPSYENWGKE